MALTAEQKQNLFNAATIVNKASFEHEAPPWAVWGILQTTKLPKGKTLEGYANEVAHRLRQAEFKSSSWEQAISSSTGGATNYANVHKANSHLSIQNAIGEPSAQAVNDLTIAALITGGAIGVAVTAGLAGAAAGTAAGATATAAEAGGGAAAGAEAAAGGAAAGAGSGAASGTAAGTAAGVASKVASVAGGALGVAGIEAIIQGYGLRLGEVIAGGLLILFGLVTLAKGSAPSPIHAAKAIV